MAHRTTSRATIALAALVAALAVAGAAGARPAATLRAPREVRLGEAVTATARNLNPGHYRLFIVLTASQGKGARPITCLGAVGPRLNVPAGERSFHGRIPAKLTCYQGTRLGTVPNGPGIDRFVLASPAGGEAFSGSRSFLERRVRVTG
ncbi:MAG TPA: hypothetical protein VGF63_02960 [Solirubrobacteraceae bacterium]|jgi:hypothetical protein